MRRVTRTEDRSVRNAQYGKTFDTYNYLYPTVLILKQQRHQISNVSNQSIACKTSINLNHENLPNRVSMNDSHPIFNFDFLKCRQLEAMICSKHLVLVLTSSSTLQNSNKQLHFIIKSEKNVRINLTYITLKSLEMPRRGQKS